ncbi:MAG: hypothetical protein ACJAUV_001176 [Flavobacteriales bacterium]|jgi:hypothetical protein
MKKTLLLVLTICTGIIHSKAQEYEVIASGLSHPEIVDILDDELYYISSEYGLQKLNTLNIPSLREEVVPSVHEGNLVYSDFQRIYNTQVTIDTVITSVLLDQSSVRYPVMHNGYLYYASNSEDIVYRIDTATNTPPEMVTEKLPWNFYLNKIAFWGDQMYILGQNPSERIRKYELGNTFPLTGSIFTNAYPNPYGLISHNNYLYYAGDNEGVRQILRIKLNENEIIHETVLDSIGFVITLGIEANQLYFSVTGDGDGFIGRLNLPVGIQEISQEQLSLYPNPTNNKIKFPNNAFDKNFKLYDLSGKIILNGLVPQRLNIDITHIPTGTYLMKVDGFESTRLVKL